MRENSSRSLSSSRLPTRLNQLRNETKQNRETQRIRENMNESLNETIRGFEKIWSGSKNDRIDRTGIELQGDKDKILSVGYNRILDAIDEKTCEYIETSHIVHNKHGNIPKPIKHNDNEYKFESTDENDRILKNLVQSSIPSPKKKLFHIENNNKNTSALYEKQYRKPSSSINRKLSVSRDHTYNNNISSNRMIYNMIRSSNNNSNRKIQPYINTNNKVKPTKTSSRQSKENVLPTSHNNIVDNNTSVHNKLDRFIKQVGKLSSNFDVVVMSIGKDKYSNKDNDKTFEDNIKQRINEIESIVQSYIDNM